MSLLKREDFLLLLDELKLLIEADDSMEGTLEYKWSDTPGIYEVGCFLRSGNSQGQGGAIFLPAEITERISKRHGKACDCDVNQGGNDV